MEVCQEYGLLSDKDVERLFSTTAAKLGLKSADLPNELGKRVKSQPLYIVSLVGWPAEKLAGVRRLSVKYSVGIHSDEVHVHPLTQLAKDQGQICARHVREMEKLPAELTGKSRKPPLRWQDLQPLSEEEARAAQATLNAMQGGGAGEDDNSSSSNDDSSDSDEKDENKIASAEATFAADGSDCEDRKKAKKRRVKEVRADPTTASQPSMLNLSTTTATRRQGRTVKVKGKDKDCELDDGVSAGGKASAVTALEFLQHDAEMAKVHSRYQEKTGKDAPSLAKLVVLDYLNGKKKDQALTGVFWLPILVLG